MRYLAKIRVEDPKIYELIKVELDFKTARSATTITKRTKGFDIDVKAEDAVALRAALNSITQLLKVYEKVEKI